MPTVKLNAITGVSTNQQDFANAAVQRLQRIVNTPAFQNKVQQGQFTGAKYCDKQGSCRTIADGNAILKFIMDGNELGSGSPADKEIDLTIKLKQLRKSTIGYVTPPHPLITTNTLHYNKWFGERDTLSVAAHWMHEWMHTVGFRHVPHSNGEPDRGDVPYMIGKYIVEVGRTTSLLLADEVPTDGQGYLDVQLEHFNDVEGSVPEFDNDDLNDNKYSVLQSVSLEALQRGVSHSIKNGWKLSGGVATAAIGDPSEQDFIYLQAIYR